MSEGVEIGSDVGMNGSEKDLKIFDAELMGKDEYAQAERIRTEVNSIKNFLQEDVLVRAHQALMQSRAEKRFSWPFTNNRSIATIKGYTGYQSQIVFTTDKNGTVLAETFEATFVSPPDHSNKWNPSNKLTATFNANGLATIHYFENRKSDPEYESSSGYSEYVYNLGGSIPEIARVNGLKGIEGKARPLTEADLPLLKRIATDSITRTLTNVPKDLPKAA